MLPSWHLSLCFGGVYPPPVVGLALSHRCCRSLLFVYLVRIGTSLPCATGVTISLALLGLLCSDADTSTLFTLPV